VRPAAGTARPRRRKGRALVLLLVLVALIALVLRCGAGFGLGGLGLGEGEGDVDRDRTSRPAVGGERGPPPAPRRCKLRLDARGLTDEGQVVSLEAAPSRCRGGADLVVTGDARQGQFDALAAAFERARVPLYRR
jgi:hypothetical protein